MRSLRFRGWLEQLAHDADAITAIHFEEVRRHVGADAAHVYGGLLATLTSWAETAGVAYQGVPVGAIKRHDRLRPMTERQMIQKVRTEPPGSCGLVGVTGKTCANPTRRNPGGAARPARQLHDALSWSW